MSPAAPKPPSNADTPAHPLPKGNDSVDPSVAGFTKREAIAKDLFAARTIGKQAGYTTREERAAAAVADADVLLAELAKPRATKGAA